MQVVFESPAMTLPDCVDVTAGAAGEVVGVVVVFGVVVGFGWATGKELTV